MLPYSRCREVMMKRALIVVISIFFFAVSGCFMDPPPDEELVLFTQDGRRLIRVNIYGDDDLPDVGGRALTTTIAKTVYNYIEVILMDETVAPVAYYDTAFRKGVTGTINAPDGLVINPTGGGAKLNAVMFAGYRRSVVTAESMNGTDLTLLAVGICTGIEYNNDGAIVTGTKTITPSTTGLRFQLCALETYVTAQEGGTIGGSVFAPVNPPGGRTNGFRVLGGSYTPPVPAITWSAHNGAPTEIGKGRIAPYFQVPSGVVGIPALMRIYGLLSGDNSAFSGYPNPATVMWAVEASELASVSFVWGGDPILTSGFVDIGMGGGLLEGDATYGDQLAADGSFILSIKTENTYSTETGLVRWADGWALVAMNLEIRMFGVLSGNLDRRTRNDIWTLRSGMYVDQPDLGYGVDRLGFHSHSLGGGILLKVGNPPLPPMF